MHQVSIAVIGGGIAGLSCAAELLRGDATVTVFERSRGLGGRLATRRHGQLAFDQGVQFMTARSRSFARFATVAARSGVAAPWRPRLLEDHRSFDQPIEDWLVGTPGMSSMLRPLTRNLELQTGVSVHELVQGQRGWELQTDSGRENRIFNAVVVALPAPEAMTLLGPHGRVFRRLGEVKMAPCWTLMAAFDRPLGAAAQAYRWTSGTLTWAACDSSKPGRPQTAEAWVAHASPEWSRQYLNADAADTAQLLLKELTHALGVAIPAPAHLEAHRWRHARVEQPLGVPCLIDEEIGAGTCGDWCIAPRAEAAFESGRSLAHSVLSMVGLSAPALLRS
ncbi:MAG TPA: FAD-dependent oxidoreductase [Steroidobacteraceae bacterium]|nr:FAD-dependent oxidoreductase [Steroidobacteraceae bacterium]